MPQLFIIVTSKTRIKTESKSYSFCSRVFYKGFSHKGPAIVDRVIRVLSYRGSGHLSSTVGIQISSIQYRFRLHRHTRNHSRRTRHPAGCPQSRLEMHYQST